MLLFCVKVFLSAFCDTQGGYTFKYNCFEVFISLKY